MIEWIREESFEGERRRCQAGVRLQAPEAPQVPSKGGELARLAGDLWVSCITAAAVRRCALQPEACWRGALEGISCMMANEGPALWQAPISMALGTSATGKDTDGQGTGPACGSAHALGLGTT